jgi:hypothetical protein
MLTDFYQFELTLKFERRTQSDWLANGGLVPQLRHREWAQRNKPDLISASDNRQFRQMAKGLNWAR